MLDPFRVAQAVQSDPRGPALIAVAQSMLREAGGFDAVEEGLAKALVQRLGAVEFGDGHRDAVSQIARRGATASKNKAERSLRL